ncbi:MAG: SpoIID/LytB domain-containing protein, partial [Chloroflexota bacterium]
TVTPTMQYRMYLPIIFKNWPPGSVQLSPPPTIRVYHELYEPKGTIEVIDFETYVKRVVPREMPASWNAEALKAQAVAARTYGWYKVLNPRSADFDVYDDTWDQVCGPDSWRDPRSDAATDATRGQYIAYASSVIIAMYSAENGDPTKTGNVAYLQAVNDPVSFGKTLFGHGYGMGQWGARRWADQYAWDYYKILKHYYTGVTVEHPRAASGDAAVPIGSVVGPWSKWYLNSKRALLVANASDDWAVQGVDFYATYNDGATYANRRLGPGTKGSAGWSYLWDLSALPDQPMGASPISVTARVSDYYGNVLSNALTVTTGLDTVVPTGTASFVSKSGDTVTMTLSATDPGASPSGVNRMSFSDGYNWRWEGEKTSGASGTYFFNNVGSAVSDPAASGGQAWKVPAGSAGWVWGPYYKSLPAERGYRAYFRLKTDNVTTTSEIAKLDVVDNGGGRVLGIFKLRGIDFRQANAYQEFCVDFYYTNPETTYGLEFRTNFTGAADVYLDRVLVVSYPVTYATSATFAPVTGSQVIVKFLDAAENISEDVVVNVP